MDKFDFPVVGIGASAGGIEALEGFFRGLPPEPGFAIVIVTHLPPERESLLHEVVRHLTTMSVTTVSDEIELKPDCVFVLTNSAILTVKQRRLIVRQSGRPERKPIDIFFSSLADDVGEMAAGVVLSGGDGDGTLGVKAIKERGGLTLAQVGNGFALTIRSYTPSVARIFSILPGDRGRPITDLSSRLNLAGLAGDIARALAGEAVDERRLTTEDRKTHYLVRLSRYRGGDRLTEGVVIAFVDITNVTRAEAQQEVLIAELQHRTRNLLTVVQSIAQRTIGKEASLEQFCSRLAALGRVQSLLSKGQSDEVDLGELVRLELESLGALQEGKVRISGPRLALPFELLQTFGLAVHELTTNALKHGALKEPTGALSISWEVRQDDGQSRLLFDWNEAGIAIPAPPKRRGFGRELIERALAFTPQAKSKLVFGPDGVTCHIELARPGRLDRQTNR